MKTVRQTVKRAEFYSDHPYLFHLNSTIKFYHIFIHLIIRLFIYQFISLKMHFRASLVAQWLRIHLPMHGTRVRALVWEDPTCRGETKPVSHNY